MWYGWNNLTSYEVQAIKRVKGLLTAKGVVFPPTFCDREVLKFIQSVHFDDEKV